MSTASTSRLSRCAAAAILALVLGPAARAADRPVKAERIPIFPGAVLVQEEKAPRQDGLRFGLMRTYTVAAAPEEVLAFYEKRTSPMKRFEDSEDENGLKAGRSTAPACQVYFWDEDRLVDVQERGISIGRRAWIKKALSGRPRDAVDGKWVESANLEWYHRDTEVSMTKLRIMIQDLSADEEALKYSIKTEIVINVVNYDYEP